MFHVKHFGTIDGLRKRTLARRGAFRKKVYRSIDELQADLDVKVRDYSESRPHLGRRCFGKTPMQMFLDTMPMTKEKTITTNWHQRCLVRLTAIHL